MGDLPLLVGGDANLFCRRIAKALAGDHEQLVSRLAGGADDVDVPEAPLVRGVCIGERTHGGGRGIARGRLLLARPPVGLPLADPRMGGERLAPVLGTERTPE